MKQIQITVAHGENFTPASLMNRYAKQASGVSFLRGRFGTAQLVIDGRVHQFHHWGITADNSTEIVSLFLEEIQ